MGCTESIPKGEYRILFVFLYAMDFFIRSFEIAVYVGKQIRGQISMIEGRIENMDVVFIISFYFYAG